MRTRASSWTRTSRMAERKGFVHDRNLITSMLCSASETSLTRSSEWEEALFRVILTAWIRFAWKGTATVMTQKEDSVAAGPRMLWRRQREMVIWVGADQRS